MLTMLTLKYTGKIINRTRIKCITRIETIVLNNDEKTSYRNNENETKTEYDRYSTSPSKKVLLGSGGG